MGAKTFASQMKATIVEIKSSGTAAIYCDNLISYLAEIENSPELEPSALEIEGYKADLQGFIEDSKAAHETDLEMFRSVIAAGQAALRTSFLLNGGGAIALLAFTGHLAQFNPAKVAEFGACILPFALGVLVVAVSSGLTYLQQWLYAFPNPWTQKAGFCLNILTIVLGIATYLLFVWGLLAAYRAFLAYA
jgi:hypothetical protein